ncbi:MAG TPA: hypothetical protein VFK57_25575 [Vicinamibacterales bacterium]|nr:hypothetical protein [Vicinamibacterales bacterium]
MTRARALKAVIRARAAKTGERYTTARRHVLAALTLAPPQPAPLSPPERPRGGVSDAKVREKTGRGLDHWFSVLDRFGGPGKGHTALARHLYDDHAVPGWYSQGITVAYERARGVRAANQRCDGEYEVSVSKVVNARVADVVEALAVARRRKRWGAGVDAALLQALSAALDGKDGKGFVVRPDGLGRFRYKWDKTTVQLYLIPKTGKVSVVATNSRLADAAMVEARRRTWRAALERLAALFASGPTLTGSARRAGRPPSPVRS